MEFRSQRARGSESHVYSGGSKRRDDRTTRPKRRAAEDDRTSYRSARSDGHRSSISEGSSKDYPTESRRMPSKYECFNMFIAVAVYAHFVFVTCCIIKIPNSVVHSIIMTVENNALKKVCHKTG
jgi:hypothetical protein